MRKLLLTTLLTVLVGCNIPTTPTVTVEPTFTPTATSTMTPVPLVFPEAVACDSEDNLLINGCVNSETFVGNFPVNGVPLNQMRVQPGWDIYFSAPPYTSDFIASEPICTLPIGCNPPGQVDQQPEFKPETMTNEGRGSGAGQQWFLQWRAGQAGLTQHIQTKAGAKCVAAWQFETKTERAVNSGDYVGLWINAEVRYEAGEITLDDYLGNQTRIVIDPQGRGYRFLPSMLETETFYGDGLDYQEINFTAEADAVDIYFETDRRWGLLYQDIRLIWASVACNEPVDDVEPVETPEKTSTPVENPGVCEQVYGVAVQYVYIPIYNTTIYSCPDKDSQSIGTLNAGTFNTLSRVYTIEQTQATPEPINRWAQVLFECSGGICKGWVHIIQDGEFMGQLTGG